MPRWSVQKEHSDNVNTTGSTDRGVQVHGAPAVHDLRLSERTSAWGSDELDQWVEARTKASRAEPAAT